MLGSNYLETKEKNIGTYSQAIVGGEEFVRACTIFMSGCGLENHLAFGLPSI